MCAFSVSAFSRAVQVMEPSPIAAFIGHVSQERSSSAHLHKWSRASENKNVRTMQGKIFTFEKEKKNMRATVVEETIVTVGSLTHNLGRTSCAALLMEFFFSFFSKVF